MLALQNTCRQLAAVGGRLAVTAVRDISKAVFATALSGVVLAQWRIGTAADDFLGPEAALRTLADGKPWSGTRPDGDRVQITFNRDGTGRFDGPFILATTWDVQGEDVCIHLGFVLGTKCVRFRTSAAGFTAYENGSIAFRLTR